MSLPPPSTACLQQVLLSVTIHFQSGNVIFRRHAASPQPPPGGRSTPTVFQLTDNHLPHHGKRRRSSADIAPASASSTTNVATTSGNTQSLSTVNTIIFTGKLRCTAPKYWNLTAPTQVQPLKVIGLQLLASIINYHSHNHSPGNVPSATTINCVSETPRNCYRYLHRISSSIKWSSLHPSNGVNFNQPGSTNGCFSWFPSFIHLSCKTAFSSSADIAFW